MYIEGEVPYVANGNNGNNNNSGWNDWSWIIGLAIIGALFGGFGGNGGFGGGGRGGFGGFCLGGAPATQADLAAGFSTNTIQRGIDDILLQNTNNLNFINQGFAGLNTAIITNGYETRNAVTGGFADLNNALCTLGYQSQAGFNQINTTVQGCCCDLRQQLSDCCCQTQRAIDGINYNMATNTCNIIRANENNTKAILDFLTNEKIEGLRAENTALKGQISNDRQSRFIIDALGPKSPVSAYVVQPPQQVTFPTNCCGNVAYANYNNNGCGGCGNF